MYHEETYVFRVSFNVLDQAVSEHIFSSPMLVFVRERRPGGSVVYKMRTQFKGQVVTQLKGKSGTPVGYDWDGNMGEISLRDLGDIVRMTVICDPPNRDDGKGPYIQLDDELCTLLTLPDGSVIRFRGPQSDDPYEVLMSHQEWIINRLFRLLQQDGIVSVSSDTEDLSPARDEGYADEKQRQESRQDPLEDARLEVRRFKSYVERQTYKDIFVGGKPQENIACALLQTFLPERSYREVQVRGGRSDLLLFAKQGRFLYEAKIWRGPKYFQQGLKELEEYIIGEGDDQELLGIFYIVFDSTKSRRAQTYRGDAFSTEVVCGRNVDVVIIDLSPPEPSKKR